jgi:hypothetical protein
MKMCALRMLTTKNTSRRCIKQVSLEICSDEKEDEEEDGMIQEE